MKTFSRRAWNKRRGSALVFTSILMVAITTVVIGTVQVNMVAAKKAEQKISEALAEQTFDAQTALVAAISKDQTITLPLSFDCLINGYKMTCTVADNSASEARTVKLTAVGSFRGTRFKYTRIIGGRQTTHPLYYALWSNDSIDMTANPLTTVGNGHVYSRGNVTLGSSTVSGDVLSTGTVASAGATVDKNVVSAVPDQVLPPIDLAALLAESTGSLNIGEINGLTFPSVLVNGHYPLNYCDKATSIRGVIAGKGTTVFPGNLTISGDLTYANGASRAVFIVDGSLTIDSTVTELSGLWFVRGKVTAEGASGTLYLPRGSLVIGGPNKITRPLAISFDPSLWNDRTEAQRHCVPGFWPTATPGILR